MRAVSIYPLSNLVASDSGDSRCFELLEKARQATLDLDVMQRVLSFGMEAVGGTPQQFADAIRDKQRIYGALAKSVKLSVD